MKYLHCALFVAGLVATSAQAQSVWITQDGQNSARVIFGEKAAPDEKAQAQKITQAKLFVRNVEEEIPLKLIPQKDYYRIAVYTGMASTVGGTCVHHVVTPHPGKPFLRVSHPKAVFGPETLEIRQQAMKAWGKLPLEIVVLSWLDNKVEFQVLWKGKSAAGCEFAAALSDRKRSQGKADAQGRFHISQPDSGESIEIRASFVEKQKGVHAGKTYLSVHHDATLTLPAHAWDFFAQVPAWAGPTKPLEHRAATELLRKALAARATWQKFPGFSAALTVNCNGNVFKTKVQIRKDGKCKVDPPEAGAMAPAFFAGDSTPTIQEHLAAVAELQLGGPVKNGPCGYVDNNVDHPLGRRIVAIDDKVDTSYRVKDNQILEFNRTTKETGFRLTGLKYELNADKKYLPANYVVCTWSNKEVFLSSASHVHTWKRIGVFDLPKTIVIIKSTYRKPEGPKFGDIAPFPWAPPVQMPGSVAPNVDVCKLTFAEHRLLAVK